MGGRRSGWRPIFCAGRRSPRDVAHGHRRQSARDARAGGGEIRAPRGAVSGARPREARGAGDGRQEHHGHSAAGCGVRVGDRHQRRGRRRAGRRGRAVGSRRIRIWRGPVRRLAGIGVSPGVVSGRAVILIQRAQVLRYQIAPARVEHEVARLEQSRGRSREQLTDIGSRVARRRGPELAALFDAQLLMLDDPMLVPRAAEIVRGQRVNAEWAVQQVFDEFSAVFDEVADPYLRERKGDVADLVGRMKMNLRQAVSTPRDLLRELDESSVLIADELTPSLAAQVDWTKVRGFATDAGSRTYHTAILARSLEVPAVVGLHNASQIVQPGQLVVVDGTGSEILLEPDAETLERATHHGEDRRPAAAADADRRRPATTSDGLRIRLDANIEFPDDLAAARYAGAEGIGLYRSE